MTNKRLNYALANLLDTVGQGMCLSDLPKDRHKLYRYALKMGYVRQTPIPGDTLIECSGRRP